jgi:hypothetical protein
MDCKEAREKLLEYLEGELDLDDKMHLEVHLFTCAACLDEIRAMEALRSAVASLPVPDPSPGFAGRLHARIEEESRPRRFTRFGAYLLSPAWAAAILAVVLGTGAALWAARTGTMQPASTAIETAAAKDGAAARSLPNTLPDDRTEGIQSIWARGNQDWTVLREGREGQLVSLALGSEEVDLEAVFQIWTAIGPQRRAMAAFAELAGFSDQEVEALLARLGKG